MAKDVLPPARPWLSIPVAAFHHLPSSIQSLMTSVSVVLGLATAFIHASAAVDSGARAAAPLSAPIRSAPARSSESGQSGPREVRVAFFVPESPDSSVIQAGDTTHRRPRAIEYDDAYYSRLKIHRIASYTELPLFGAEYILGERLLKDQRTGYPPSSLKAAHLAVAGGLGVLFAVNTVTGVWNLWDSRHDPANRTLRIIHSVAMLGADAGFAWAGAIGGNAKNNIHSAQQHRTVSVGSMAVATAGTAIMWLFDR